jgi:tricarballylate dehydrogenase
LAGLIPAPEPARTRLYATGEITGDFFHCNYAAGSGLMRWAVFGRMAGANAARDPTP